MIVGSIPAFRASKDKSVFDLGHPATPSLFKSIILVLENNELFSRRHKVWNLSCNSQKKKKELQKKRQEILEKEAILVSRYHDDTIRGSEGAFSERPKPDKVGAPPKPPRVGAPPKPPRVGYYPDYILRLMRFGIMDSHSHPKTNGELFDKISSVRLQQEAIHHKEIL